MITGSFFLIALVDLWVHGEEDAKAKLHMQEMYWGNREWEMFLGIGGESHQTIPGTSWNHDAMIFPVTLLDLFFKNNFLYTQYLIWCCHRGNVSVLSKKQTHHWIIITPITYVVPLALMKGERKERLNRKRLQTQDGGLRNLSRLMRVSDLLEPWEGSHIRINWPEPVSLTGSAWGWHGVSLHGGWACVTCQSSPLPAGGAAGERLEQRHSMATKVHPWWYTDPLLTDSQAPILLGANSDPVSQSPCDIWMVPFPQCTFSLSTTIGPFGEGLERLSQDSLAAASQSLSCEGFSYLFISWAQDLELSRRSWLIIDQIASISCSIILDFSYCPPVMNNPSSGITSTTPSFLPGQQRKVITKCLSEGLHFTKLFWCVLQSPRWNVISRGSCSLNIKLILHAHSPAPLFLLPPAARPS